MVDYIATNAPFINDEFVITAVFPTYPGGAVHNGYDLATSIEKSLYSMVDGVVVDKGFQANGYGNYIIIKDNVTNYGILYGHMKYPTHLAVGNSVTRGTFCRN